MKLLIKFPTRGRREKFFNVLQAYIENCTSLENTTFLLTLDSDDDCMTSLESLERLNNLQVQYRFGVSKSKIDAVNRDLETFQDPWDILLLASDDMIPVRKGYDDVIRDNMKTVYPDTDGVLWFNDGYQGNKLNTLSILGRKYYDRFQYIYYPDYKSVWADNEFMDVANILQRQTYFDDIIIRHEHPDWGYDNVDEIHTLNQQNESYDRGVYYSRKNVNFNVYS
jgi:hypothetical protein